MRPTPRICLTLVGAIASCGDASSSDQESGSTGASDSTGSTQDGPTDDSAAESSSGGDTVPPGVYQFRVGDFEVPALETYYGCWDLTITVDQLTHLIGFVPVVDNAPYVHHFVVSMIDEPTGQPDGYACFDIAGNTVWTWAPGQSEFMLPEEAGFLVGGDAGGEVHLRLQIHYNNPLQTAGQIDDSGFDVHTTQDLRPHDAGTLVFGDVTEIEIPPGESAYEHIMTCRGSLTDQVFLQPLNVFASSMHAHELGRLLYTEVYRGGELVGEINRDDPFVFDSQIMRPVDFVLEPGDEIVNHCVYDSTARTEVTYGGLGTSEEMCWNTVVYYPRLSNGFDFCTSSS